MGFDSPRTDYVFNLIETAICSISLEVKRLLAMQGSRVRVSYVAPYGVSSIMAVQQIVALREKVQFLPIPPYACVVQQIVYQSSKLRTAGQHRSRAPLHRLVLGRDTFEAWSNEVK